MKESKLFHRNSWILTQSTLNILIWICPIIWDHSFSIFSWDTHVTRTLSAWMKHIRQDSLKFITCEYYIWIKLTSTEVSSTSQESNTTVSPCMNKCPHTSLARYVCVVYDNDVITCRYVYNLWQQCAHLQACVLSIPEMWLLADGNIIYTIDLTSCRCVYSLL